MAFQQSIGDGVRSESLENGKRKEKARSSGRGAQIAGGVFLIIVGAMLWVAGARYTLYGWHTVFNWFFAWLGLPARIPPIVGYAVLLCIPVGVTYSLVELRRPWKYRAKDWNAIALYWIVWIIIVVSDGGTTFLGVRAPGADALMLAQQVAQSAALSAVWSLILTFIPEWFILGGIRLLRR